jgi:predicted nucleotidyltransferase
MIASGSKISLAGEQMKRAVEEFVKRATQKYGDRIRGVTLFGSAARGAATEESDVDILVVIDEEDFLLRRDLVGLPSISCWRRAATSR